MGRKAVPAAFKKSRQFCAMFTEDEARRITEAVEAGHYATPSDLMRDAIAKLVAELEASRRQT